MVESDYDLAIEDTDRINGRTALVNNVRAASSLAARRLGHRGRSADVRLVNFW